MNSSQDKNTRKSLYYKSNKFQQLRGFYNTVITGSVTRAASKMRLSQPTISIQIQSLQEELGTELFKKEGRSLVPTDDGKILFELMSPHMEGIDSIYEKFIHEKEKRFNKKINICANHITALYILPPVLKKFSEVNPDIIIELCIVSIEEGQKRLREEETDILIGPQTEYLTDEFKFYKTVSYHPILITHKTHPLVKEKHLTFKKIAKYPMLTIDSRLITVPTFKNMVKQYGLSCNLKFENGDWIVTKALVEENFATAVLLDLPGIIKDENICHLDISHLLPDVNYGYTIVKNRYVISHVEKLLEIMKEQLTNS